MPIPQEILKLVERFDSQREAYQSGKYNEAQIRAEFIDPLFKALGWDVHNEQGYAEAYKDVIHEDAIKIGGATEAPDLCFRIGGARKFFVECKKPSVNIKEDVHPAYQLRRYAWSARLPLSILTDFEELAVYDCRAKPNKNDTSAIGRLMYFTSKQFAEKWDEFAAIFSREAVLKGSFDKFAEGTKGRKGTASVDDAFLEEIERWRDMLARNITMRNEKLSQRELNFAVQRIIDRIIFLRICEDRGIEPYGRLMTLRNGERVYSRLGEFFRRADERYNSGIFCFTKNNDSGGERADELTLTLTIDDKVIKDIVGNLYYPESPYEFSVLPADILGHVYERFLGKVIRLTAGHQAKVEDKPEVRKAGGVYYTPTYIVDYIVKNTVGKLLEGKTPRQAAKLKILDPACGSGSFLLGAYQYLLNWHRDWYVKNGPEKNRKVLYQASGDWRMTTDEKKRILLNNIYGVDIDSQAVEVTKLSLLLKVLEGESQETITKQFELFHQRALPDLGSNIKCGNSLIGPECYKDQQLSLLPEEDRYRINVFDWQAEFPEIFKAGGPDAIIGNPPYIRIQGMKEWAPVEVELYKTLYRSAAAGNYDIYVVFVEKALSLLNKTGRTGFILPHKFFNAQYGEALRGVIAEGRHLAHVVHFGDQQVFTGATTYTCLMFLDKAGANECRVVKVNDLVEWQVDAASSCGVKRQDAVSTTEGQISTSTITASEWNFAVGESAGLISNLNSIPTKLGNIADIFVGLQTSADDVFILDYIGETAREIRLKSKVLDREYSFEKGLLFPLVSGTDISRYRNLASRQFILFPFEVRDEKATLIPFNVLEKDFPKTASYLVENKERLEGRENGKFRGVDWYKFGRSQNLGIQQRIKLCVPRLVDELCAAYDFDGTHFLDNVDVGGVTLKPGYEQQGLPYILALLNSKLLRWFFPNVSTPFRGGWYSANRQFLSKVPIRTVNFSIKSDVAKHHRIVALVESMLEFHKKVQSAQTPDEKIRLEREIAATDREIDQLVYELYGLTEEEIKIVEERGDKKDEIHD